MKPATKVLIAVVAALVIASLLWMITRGGSRAEVTRAPLVLPQLPSTGAPATQRPTAAPTMAPSVFPTQTPGIMGYADDDEDYGML